MDRPHRSSAHEDLSAAAGHGRRERFDVGREGSRGGATSIRTAERVRAPRSSGTDWAWAATSVAPSRTGSRPRLPAAVERLDGGLEAGRDAVGRRPARRRARGTSGHGAGRVRLRVAADEPGLVVELGIGGQVLGPPPVHHRRDDLGQPHPDGRSRVRQAGMEAAARRAQARRVHPREQVIHAQWPAPLPFCVGVTRPRPLVDPGSRSRAWPVPGPGPSPGRYHHACYLPRIPEGTGDLGRPSSLTVMDGGLPLIAEAWMPGRAGYRP